VASHAAHRSGGCHDGNRSSVILVVGGHHDAVNVVDGQSGVPERAVGGLMHGFFKRCGVMVSWGMKGTSDHADLQCCSHPYLASSLWALQAEKGLNRNQHCKCRGRKT